MAADAVHLLALCEVAEEAGAAQGVGLLSQSERARLGFAFLDAAAGRFYIGSSSDDAGRASLGAILVQVSRASRSVITSCHVSRLMLPAMLLVQMGHKAALCGRLSPRQSCTLQQPGCMHAHPCSSPLLLCRWHPGKSCLHEAA